MKHLYTSLCFAFVAFGLLGGASAAHAASDASATFKSPAHAASSVAAYTKKVQRRISASEAKAIARRQVRGGEVVDIALRGGTFRVRVIAPNGQVVDVYIDAATGRVK